MAASRNAKYMVFSGVAMLPPCAVVCVLALRDSKMDANAMVAILSATAFVLAAIRAFRSHGTVRVASGECDPKPSRIFWLGVGSCPLLGILVLLELMRDGRQLPQGLSWLELSPAASKWFITVGVAFTLLGVGLIAYDLARMWVDRAIRDIKYPRPASECRRKRRYWPVNRLAPELDSFPADEQAADAQRRAGSRIHSGACFFIAFFVILPGTSPLVWPWMPSWVSFLAVPVVFVVLGVYLWLRKETFRRSIREELCKVGIPTCIECGYDLRGQVEPRCPECGSAFDASLVDLSSQPIELQ